jgi:hypothetical protein
MMDTEVARALLHTYQLALAKAKAKYLDYKKEVSGHPIEKQLIRSS